MKVEQIMSRNPRSCGPNSSLDVPARTMWESDCGFVPVIDHDKRCVGVITDRDICMAALTQGRPISEIPVETAMSRQVAACHPNDDVAACERLMSEKQVRRLPVLDQQGKLVGVVSLNDLTRENAREGLTKARDL